MQPTIEKPDAASLGSEGLARRRLAVATVALFLAGLFALMAAPAQSAEQGLPKITGSLSRFGADAAAALGIKDLKAASDPTASGLGLLYPKLDRIYQLYNLEQGTKRLAVVERSLDTLAITRTLVIPDHSAMLANDASGAEWVATFNTKDDRLYIAYRPSGGLQGAVTAPDKLPGLLGIDLRSFAYSDSTFPNFVVSTADSSLILVGLEYDESTDTLLALQEAIRSDTAVANALVLVGWQAAALVKGGPLPQVTPRPVRACKRDPVSDASSPFLTPMLIASAPDPDDGGRVKTWVTFPCYSTNYSTNVVIVRLDRATALDPNASDEKAVVAPAGVINWALDGAHGRMYLVNNSAETDAWVYEVASNAFVGIIALSPKNALEANSIALGVDEQSGRLYGRAPSYGLMISAAAQDPVPQADVYPRLAAGGAYRLLVDSKRHRLFSLTGTPSSGGASLKYDVIAVPPPLPTPAKEDPDSRTAQVDEAVGRTVPQYGGNASAYGLRVLFARGLSGAVPSNGNKDLGELYKSANSYCGYTDRELVLARVSKTEFSNTSRFAKAAAVEPDNATTVDLETPSRCDIYNSYKGDAPVSMVTPFLSTTGALGDADKKGVPASSSINTTAGPHTKWDYKPADCSTPNGKDQAGPNTKPLVGPTSVACTKDDEITAQAESRVKPADALDITVTRATTSTKVSKDKAKGLVSTATARLEGVRIGDVSIGYIVNSATSFAKGRKGTAGTVFDKPQIGFVDGPGIPTCTDQCDLDAVLKALNSALAGRAEFRRVSPSDRLAQGSPGGYEAGILKSEKQQASDNSLSGDKSVEIPALEMVVYNDNANIGRARQVYQFAGVRADSHYGVQLAGAECSTCGDAIGASIDVGTGVVGAAPPLLNDGQPLLGRVMMPSENVLRRFVRQAAAGADYSLRIIFSNPRDAMVMATVWVLLWGPFVASRRRRALRAVADADPEGSSR